MTETKHPEPGSDAADARGKAIINESHLTFDSGDPLNGSLYVCSQDGTNAEQALEEAISRLRASGLWSEKVPSEVQQSQKAAYSEQLRFVKEKSVTVAGTTLLLAQYDHPRFPSDSKRYLAWCRCLSDQ